MTATRTRFVTTVAATAVAAALAGCGISVSDDSGPDGSAAPKPPAVDTDPGSPPGSPADSSDHDPCLLGTWSSPPENASWDRLTFADDGSYDAHFGASTATVEITETGQWLTSDGSLSTFKPSYAVNGQEVSGDDLAKDLGLKYLVSTVSLSYSCSANSVDFVEPISGTEGRWTR
ncbi:MAG: hypothetical protein FWF02_09800 [Micrococcales bacterium]|nr:hypothetical protein [Micrococcales bacterium]MCL2667981.1 hypothetical protein [Micrococcales bacterium]